ncbi:hypothetical protein FB566_2051 [Stackebrandtia endophytica]|uniref:SseB protein N-terminal domain-containing protein n=1 Tax=Stackebrandtia endophytica TaxID=1496996 RepID=A0A543AVB0_9ACTN|nr:hypothetical protein [Stackebrandtia endophytica]TQL76519.1 hypothetical protein FB566_2051 [Stackebrandtia endophytica]
MWEPATDIEQQMREALRAGRREDYFRLLSRLELLLPVSGDGISAPGSSGSWATWSTQDRTHVLAFTSESALRSCLRIHAGPFRTVRFTVLSDSWPDDDWWLAVNPGLPIEGYLPAWFVSQIATGDTTLPDQDMDPAAYESSGPVPMDDPAWPQSSAASQSAASGWGEPPAASPGWGDSAPAGTPGWGEPPAAPAASSGWGEPPAPASTPGWGEAPAAPPAPAASSGWGDSASDSGWGAPPPAGPAPDSTTSSGLPSRAAAQAQSPGEHRYGQGYDPAQSRETSSSFAADSAMPPAAPAPSMRSDFASPTPEPSTGIDPTNPPPLTTVVGLSEVEVEDRLAQAAALGDTETFLGVLMQAWAYLPLPDDVPEDARPGDAGFRWFTDLIDGAYTATAFTTQVRLAARYGDRRYIRATFARVAQHWPGTEYSLYVNPGTEVGANMPGPQVTALLTWAKTKGLIEAAHEMESQANRSSGKPEPAAPEMMQKVVPHHQVPLILERGYDRVGGFVHRLDEVSKLITPHQLYWALGLLRDGGGFSSADDSVHVLRWMGHRTELYRRAFGGNDTDHARSQPGGWVVEPLPFRGDGYAPDPDGRQIAEYKVDSVRLPHGAAMWQIFADGSSAEIAVYDADRREWTKSDTRSPGDAYEHSYRQEQQHA